MTFIVVMIAAFVVLGCCLLFVFHKDYDAGFTGGLGFGLLALGSIARLAELFHHAQNTRLTPLALVVWSGLALVFGRMAIRFLYRRWRSSNWYH